MDSISLLGCSPANTKVCFLPNGLKNGSKEGSGKPTVAIIGSGDFSKSLTLRLLRSGFHVVVGSRQPKRAAESFPHVVDVTHHEDAVGKANIVFLAIRREHYSSLWDIKHLLAGKILVDVSNNRRLNQYPESMLNTWPPYSQNPLWSKASMWSRPGPCSQAPETPVDRYVVQNSVYFYSHKTQESLKVLNMLSQIISLSKLGQLKHRSKCFCSDLLAELQNSLSKVYLSPDTASRPGLNHSLYSTSGI